MEPPAEPPVGAARPRLVHARPAPPPPPADGADLRAKRVEFEHDRLDPEPPGNGCDALGLRRACSFKVVVPGAGLTLRLSVAPPVGGGAPTGVLYVLDPEPELFVLVAAHVLSRAGYDSESAPPSPLRGLAVVGVGHHPDAMLGAATLGFRGADGSWDVDAMRALRRRDFLGRDAAEAPGRFLDALCDVVVPRAEAALAARAGGSGARLPAARRAILGCSLSALVGLRALFDGGPRGAVFGRFILGSPSLPLCPEVVELERRPEWARGARRVGARVFFAAGELEGNPRSGGNSIPKAAQRMADALKKRGVAASDVQMIKGEEHGTAKPSIVSRGLSWLEATWS